MARKPRVEYPGALYHVMCRGNNGETIFSKDVDKSYYIALISKYKKRYSFNLYAYCIMDNHAHMLIETGNTRLSKIMQGIQQSYTQWFNKRYNRTGHVFQQRYKALLCDRDSYLLQLIKYIHYNPVKANLKEGFNYKWSSHRDYLKLNKASIVDVLFILEILGGNKINRGLKEYKRFMDLDEGPLKIEEYLIDEKEIYLMLQEFEQEVAASADDNEVDIDRIIDMVCEKVDISKKELAQKTKQQSYVDARKAIILLSTRYSTVTNIEISNRLGISSPVISNVKRGKGDVSDSVKMLMREVSQQIAKEY
ncbi:transposase [Proteinivorax hydrogeniformans]|uniref:Transposase n=1 Tax=Proteinivorax hydrogeniformans TaxID=1826727 RepID=A0AAU8HST8_9FIRM